MVSTRARQSNKGLGQIEDLRLQNAAINNKERRKKEEEERNKRAEAKKDNNEVSQAVATITPKNLHNWMDGGLEDSTARDRNSDTEEEEDISALMVIEGDEDKEREEDTSGMSPVKKRSKGKKRTSSRPRVMPPDLNSSDNNKVTSFLDEMKYSYSRVILELAIALKSKSVFEEFTQALMAFITNAQMVDPKFVINPISPTSKEKNISNKGEISSNMTKLGTHIKISGNGSAFNKKKVWNNQSTEQKSRKTQKEEFRDPVVYFSMIISMEVEPSELINRLTHEWARLNGTRLQVKELQSISSETVVTFFKMSTYTPKKVLLTELTRILLETQKRVVEEFKDRQDLYDLNAYDFSFDEGIKYGETLPSMNLRVQNALLRGQEVTVFNKLSHHAQLARKSWHLEVDSRHAKKMKDLIIQRAKTYGCVEEMWGVHAHLSEVTDALSTVREAKRQVDVAQAHTNYQLSMVTEELNGVVNVDEPLVILHPTTNMEVGTLSLRTVLLNYLKMEDGHPMIAEVHQEEICKPTHVIVPQTEEAERMIGMMNKNLPAFIYHMLLEIDFTEDIINKLLKNSCEASLVAQISQCKWVSSTRTLTTPEEEIRDKAVKSLEMAAWFKDEFGFLKRGPQQMPALPIDAQFDLGATGSVKTIHDRHQQQPVSILKTSTTAKNASTKTTRCDAVDLSKDDDDGSHSGDSASQTSTSSGEDTSLSNERSCSATSDNYEEEMGAAGSG